MIQNRQFMDELAELQGCIYAFLDHQAVLAQSTGVLAMSENKCLTQLIP
jgi:hypothetical protein